MAYRRRGVCGDEPRALDAERRPAATRRGSRTKAHRLLAASAVGLAGVLLAARGSDDRVTEASDIVERPNTVAVVGTDRLRFEPDEFTMPAGQRVTLELTADSVEHDFVVEDAAQFGAAETGHQADGADTVRSDQIGIAVVLKDATGAVVGADSADAENVPDRFPPGTKFNVEVHGIVATAEAATAEVTAYFEPA